MILILIFAEALALYGLIGESWRGPCFGEAEGKERLAAIVAAWKHHRAAGPSCPGAPRDLLCCVPRGRALWDALVFLSFLWQNARRADPCCMSLGPVCIRSQLVSFCRPRLARPPQARRRPVSSERALKTKPWQPSGGRRPSAADPAWHNPAAGASTGLAVLTYVTGQPVVLWHFVGCLGMYARATKGLGVLCSCV